MIFAGKRILVTGGTGSLGKVLVRRILSGEHGVPEKLVVLSRDEAKQHQMRIAHLRRNASTDEVIYRNFLQVLEFRIGDVRCETDLRAAVRGAHYVINAAALKQVPTCEYFPGQALLTNCLGAENLVRAVAEVGTQVEAVVGVSTDKACKPVNVMGMTKALQERILIAANVHTPTTRFLCVRYGNVLASRGSVVPLFLDQIASGGPVTLTDPSMTRFLLSLDRAVDTIIAALEGGKRGETWIPRVPSATVANLAAALIGDRRVATRVVGIRPGEKLHEILVSEEEYRATVARGRHYAIRPMLPELAADQQEEGALSGEYSSSGGVLDLDGTRDLLRQHHLLPEQAPRLEGGELLA